MVTLRLDSDLLDLVEAYVQACPSGTSRSEALRVLLRAGLEPSSPVRATASEIQRLIRTVEFRVMRRVMAEVSTLTDKYLDEELHRIKEQRCDGQAA